MTEERKFEFDEKKKILTVKVLSNTENKFTLEQCENIYRDLQSKVTQGEGIVKRSKDMKVILKKMEQPRFKELIESVALLVPQVQVPNKESVDKTLKHWNGQLKVLKDDMKNLEPYINKK